MANANSDDIAARRPLSPHLSVYKPMLTMAMSMAHRITGAALYASVLLLALFLLGAGLGGWAFGLFGWIGGGLFGKLVVFLFTWAVFHHLLGGVRHALWDRGLYMDPVGREFLAQATLAGGIGLAILLWIAVALFG